MKLSTEELIARLRTMSEGAVSVFCNDCEHLPKCRATGCVLLQEAAARLERLNADAPHRSRVEQMGRGHVR